MKKKDEKQLRSGLVALFGDPSTPVDPKPEEDVIEQVEDRDLRDAILHRRQMIGRGRPKKNVKHESTTAGYVRVTTIANSAKLEKIKEISRLEGLQIKEVFEAMMDQAIEAYEKKNGVIIPKGKTAPDTSNLFK